MAQADEAARGLDVSVPNAARMYDYFLGGKDNFEADRVTAERLLALVPQLRQSVVENRRFIGRVVRYLAAEAGITQFLDLGSGLPRVGNVHEVAQNVNPAARVVYVDNDPIVLVHSRALLVSNPLGACEYIQEDIRNPEAILRNPATRATLDFGRPVVLLLVAILHFFPDEEESGKIVRTLVDALPSGSYVVASHGTAEYAPLEAAGVGRAYQRGGVALALRDSGEFADLVFRGLSLVPPGVVPIPEWRPEPGAVPPPPAEVSVNGGVARKP